MNKLDIQPRLGFAYAISEKMSIRGGVGLSYISDQSSNGSDGFSSSTSYTNSLDNGLTPYTSTTGQGLSNPIPVVPQPSGSSLGYFAGPRQVILVLQPELPDSVTLVLEPDLRDSSDETRCVLG